MATAPGTVVLHGGVLQEGGGKTNSDVSVAKTPGWMQEKNLATFRNQLGGNGSLIPKTGSLAKAAGNTCLAGAIGGRLQGTGVA
jgi:hypothetical protein